MFDLGKGKELKDLRITWDAKADFGGAEKHEKIKGCADNPWDVGVGDEALHEKVKVKLTVSPTEPD